MFILKIFQSFKDSENVLDFMKYLIVIHQLTAHNVIILVICQFFLCPIVSDSL